MTVCIDFSFDMDHFHSCDQWLHKLRGTKGIFCMKKEFNSHTIFLGGRYTNMAAVSLFLHINLRFSRSPYCNLLSPQNLAEVLFLIFQERLLVPREIEKST